MERARTSMWNRLTIIAVALLVVVGVPVGASAVAGNNVFVTDQNSGARAKVDSGGNLQTKVNGRVTATRAPVDQMVFGALDNPIKSPSKVVLAAPANASVVVNSVHVSWDSAQLGSHPYLLIQLRGPGGCGWGDVLLNESVEFSSFAGIQQLSYEPGLVIQPGGSLCAAATDSLTHSRVFAFGYRVPT